MEMRKVRAVEKATDWKKLRIGNRQGSKEDETKRENVCVRVCMLACKVSHCDEAD